MPVDTAYIGRWTALHVAAANGHLEVVEFFLGQGASLGIETENGSTAVDLAFLGGHGAVARYLDRAVEAARAELDSLGIDFTEGAFLEAAEAGNLAVVKLFVTAGMSVNIVSDWGYTVLHSAARGGSLEVVR